VAKLRLMIDEDYWSLTPYLDGVSNNITASTSERYGCPSGTADNRLVEKTKREGCILVTLDDNTIKRTDYPPCEHGGIIFIQSKNLSEANIKKMFRHFCLSNTMAHTKGHLTYLYKDHAVIFTHNKRITVRWYISNKRKKYDTVEEARSKNDPMTL